MLMPLSYDTPMLSFCMKSQTQRPTLGDRRLPRSGRGAESFVPLHSLALSAVEGSTLSSTHVHPERMRVSEERSPEF